MTIYQGDQYAVPITITRNGQVQTSANVSRLEVIFAGMRKLYPGDIVYNPDTMSFLFPLDQNETLALEADTYDVIGRPLFTDGTIEGWSSVGSISVIEMEGAESI